MAWLSTTIWEVRNTGNDINGGAYDPSFGGTDYSEQDAAQLALADFATPGAGSTTLTTPTGGLTPAMVGNGFHPQTSGNWVEDFYCITAWASANSVTLDRSPTPAGAGVAGNGTVGGGIATLNKLAAHNDYVSGNTIWIKTGTTLSADVTLSVSGSGANLPIIFDGYQTARGDTPLLGNRPLITCGANYINDSGYRHIWRHLRMTGNKAVSPTFKGGYYGTLYNVFVENTLAGGNETAYQPDAYSKAIACAFTCPSGKALWGYAAGESQWTGCYVYDCAFGIILYGGATASLCTVADASDTGIACATNQYDANLVMNNTVYNCGNGIVVTNFGSTIINNILASCTIGLKDAQLTNFVDYNNYFNNGTDVQNATKGPHALALDPQFTNAPGGDFSIGANLKAGGFPGAFDGGLSTGYLDMGAVQRQEPAAGGSYAWGGTS